MKIKNLLILFTAFVLSSAAEAKVGIASWAYVLKEPNELISNYGESIFQLDKNTFTGPLHEQNDVKKILSFTITGNKVVGTISDAKSPTELLAFEGSAIQVKSKDGAGCQITIKMMNELNYVAIELSAPSCMP